MNPDFQNNEVLQARIKMLNLEGFRYHFFLCAGPKCCAAAQGDQLWEFVKRRLQELNLVNTRVYRTKVHCLRVCQQGPIGLVYPSGTWYGELSEAKVERIIQEHFIGDHPVQEFTLATSPLFEAT